LEREGVGGLFAMQFYADRAANELSAVVTFSEPLDMPAHVEMISSWPEFASFAQSIRIKDMRIHGQLSPDMEAWIRKFQDRCGNSQRTSAASCALERLHWRALGIRPHPTRVGARTVRTVRGRLVRASRRG
jgi:hypothetical protein